MVPFNSANPAGGSQPALTIAVHMQLSCLEGSAIPPLVLPPDVEQWFEGQLDAARAAPPPVLPHPLVAAAQQQQEQQGGSPSLRQKRKWQPGSPELAQAEQQPAALAARSWAAVVAGGRAPAQAAAGISKLPFWAQLKQQIASEQQQALGLKDHAVLAAAGLGPVGAPMQWGQVAMSNGGGFAAAAAAPSAAAASASPLLQALRQQAAAEKAAAARLLSLV